MVKNDSLPLVSVVMPAYNASPFIGTAIQSVLGQSMADFELIVIDDCSTDSTAEIVQACIDDRVKLRSNAVNLGISANRNLGIDLSRGKYIAWLDADDIALPQRLEKQVSFLETNLDYGLCCSNVRTIDARGRIISRPWRAKRHLPLEWDLLWANPVAQSSVMLRKSVLEEQHLRYLFEHAPAEDYNLWSRLVGRTRLFASDEVLIHYRVLESSAYHQREVYALARSLESNQVLISTLVENAVPWHRRLTAFATDGYDKSKPIGLAELRSWMNFLAIGLCNVVLLSEAEKREIQEDIEDRVLRFFLATPSRVPPGSVLCYLFKRCPARTSFFLLRALTTEARRKFGRLWEVICG